MNKNKKSLNEKVINIIITILIILIIVSIVLSFIVWTQTNNLISIITGFLCVLGILFNIYLLSRAKSQKKE